MVKSLGQLCQQAAVKNIHLLSSVGDMPYHLAKPILMRADAKKLRQIEENSGNIQEDTAELWHRLIAKDYDRLHKKKQYVPEDEQSWHAVYFQYKEEQDADDAAAIARLTADYDKVNKEKARKEPTFVSVSEMPAHLRQASTIGSGWHGAGAGRRAGSGGSSNLTWGGGSRTKPTSGQNMLKRARREAKEVANRRAISGPIGARAGQIKVAPRTMVNDHRLGLIAKKEEKRLSEAEPINRIIAAPRRKPEPGGLLAKGRAQMLKVQQPNATTTPAPRVRVEEPRHTERKLPANVVSANRAGGPAPRNASSPPRRVPHLSPPIDSPKASGAPRATSPPEGITSPPKRKRKPDTSVGCFMPAKKKRPAVN